MVREGVLLTDESAFPDDAVLKDVLGPRFEAYRSLIDAVTGPDHGLAAEWRYYRDGKAWLCKVTHRRKTVFWLSAWDEGLKTAFYFSEKNEAGVFDLDIDAGRKDAFRQAEPIGRVKPLVVVVRDGSELPDVLELARYRKGH